MALVKYVNKNGVRLKGATTIIGNNLGWNKSVLLAWQAREFKAGNDPTQKSKTALDIGTLCHYYIESWFKKQEIDSELKSKYTIDAILIAEQALEKFKEKLKQEKLEIIQSELSLVSEQYQYGGTIDLILQRKTDGAIILGDIKTSKSTKDCPTGIYPDHIIQLGAYNQLLKENTEYKDIKEFLYVHIDKITTNPEEIISFVPTPQQKILKGFETFEHLLFLDQLNYSGELNL